MQGDSTMTSRRRTRRSGSGLRILVVAALVLAACGPKDAALEASGGTAALDVARGGAASTGGASTGGRVTGGGSSDASAIAGHSGSGSVTRSGSTSGPGSTAGDGSTGPAARGGDTGGAAAPSADGPTPGITDDRIRIAAHVPLSQDGIPIDQIAGGVQDAIEMFQRYTNQVRGGINGRQLEIVIADDGFNAGQASTACRELASQEPFLLLGYGGTDQIITCARYAIGEGLTYLSPGVAEAGLAGQPGYFAMTATYERQAPIVADLIADRIGDVQATAMVTPNSPNQDGYENSLRAALDARGLPPVVVDRIDPQGNDSELLAECLKLSNAGADVVAVNMHPLVLARFVRTCKNQGYEPQYVSMSTGGELDLLIELAGDAVDGMLHLSRAHHPFDIASGGAVEAEARDAWNRYGDGQFDPLLIFLWGFLDMMRQPLIAAGPDINTNSFRTMMQTFSYDNGVISPIQFSPGDNIGGHAVVLYEADVAAGRFVEIDPTWTNDY
jgi:branched-chain amino acid transport system substrate-binding protein